MPFSAVCLQLTSVKKGATPLGVPPAHVCITAEDENTGNSVLSRLLTTNFLVVNNAADLLNHRTRYYIVTEGGTAPGVPVTCVCIAAEGENDVDAVSLI